jgi:transcriptional regulator of NAD metabolism
MGARGYILVKLKSPLSEDELWGLVKQFESMDDVEFAARVIGPYDFVLTIDTKSSLDAVKKQIDSQGEYKKLESLKIDNIFIKHREIKDLKIFDDLKQQ